MNGFIRKTVAGLCLGGGLASMTGCYCYRQLVDPCYPERYNYQARHSVRDTFCAQAYNGHVLDQTIWSHFFEVEQDQKTKEWVPTDKLNPAGREHLKYLARRRPEPDAKVYLQTVQDLPASVTVDKLAQYRTELDSRRVLAVRNYLAALMVGRTHPTEFEVVVHDPATPNIYALPISGTKTTNVQGALPSLYNNFTGTVSSGGGSSGGGGGGGGGGSSGGGR